ncbi:MAG TPA: TRAP transporter fused permease subunit [Gemmatimonadaceae bacterium]|nr:TRAP transporter fused permease subunit [Gemmatimonadaceae bacterium]
MARVTAPDPAPRPREEHGSATAIVPSSDDAERGARELRGRARLLGGALAAGMSALAVVWVLTIVEPLVYRALFLALALAATWILYPAGRRDRASPTPVDAALIALSLAALGWPILDRAAFVYRAATPTALDLVLGIALIVLVLEATRRTVGWILPAVAAGFLIYAYLGPVLELVGFGAIAHRGYMPDRLVGLLYMTLDGIFGVPLDVAATYIVLFALFGAVLEQSGAGAHFIRWAGAAAGRRSVSGPARAVTLAGFLLGTVSGSGVATTVTLGAVAWPSLRAAGYSREHGGALLAASGIGAILAPPALGAAAFLLAEFLRLPYVRVLGLAAIPAALYYWCVLLTIAADAPRLGIRALPPSGESVAALTRRGIPYLLPIAGMVTLLGLGFTAFRAVFWATLLAIALSWVMRAPALGVRRLARACAAGGRAVLPVAATTATAGIIVGVVTLTGLGLKLSGLLVGAAGGQPVLTVLYAAVAVWVLGLAVPVTASYIIAAVMIAPALVQVGIPDIAAHMFIFYYAVLSEVTPPTALSPFAAAALTGGNPFRTMMLTWKYTLPAFAVPLVFTLSDGGRALLLDAAPPTVVRVTAGAALGLGAIAVALGGSLGRPLNRLERLLTVAGGVLLLLADSRTDLAGVGVLSLVLALRVVRRRRAGSAAPSA